MTGDAMVPVT